MRVRIVKQTLNAIWRYRILMKGHEDSSYAFQMISHKVMRYLVPFFLMAVSISNAFLVDTENMLAFFDRRWEWPTAETFWAQLLALSLMGQIAFYLAAVIGYVLNRLGIKRLGPLALPAYFVLVNMAVLFAMMKSVGGENYVVWEPNREAEATKIDNLHPLRG
jgi:hypothetical protein